MQLVLIVPGAVAAKQIADVAKLPPAKLGKGAGNDVDVVLNGERLEIGADGFRVLGELADRIGAVPGVKMGHQGGIEVFGKQHEVRTVVRDDAHEVTKLDAQVVERRCGSHLPLHGRNAHDPLGLADERGRLALMMDIDPLGDDGVSV